MSEAFYTQVKDAAEASFARQHVCPFITEFYLNLITLPNLDSYYKIRYKGRLWLTNTLSSIIFDRNSRNGLKISLNGQTL